MSLIHIFDSQCHAYSSVVQVLLVVEIVQGSEQDTVPQQPMISYPYSTVDYEQTKKVLYVPGYSMIDDNK